MGRANTPKYYKYETTIDEKLIKNLTKKENTKKKEDFKLRYSDPEVNPFYFIFHNNYSPYDFAVDTIECLLSIGCERSHILELVNKIYNESYHIRPNIRVHRNLRYPGDTSLCIKNEIKKNIHKGKKSAKKKVENPNFILTTQLENNFTKKNSTSE